MLFYIFALHVASKAVQKLGDLNADRMVEYRPQIGLRLFNRVINRIWRAYWLKLGESNLGDPYLVNRSHHDLTKYIYPVAMTR